MNDLVDIFYRDINNFLDEYTNKVVKKNLLDKLGEIELVPINLAKGELDAINRVKIRSS